MTETPISTSMDQELKRLSWRIDILHNEVRDFIFYFDFVEDHLDEFDLDSRLVKVKFLVFEDQWDANKGEIHSFDTGIEDAN